MELILDVTSSDEYVSGPEVARIELGAAEIERIAAMHRVAVEHELLSTAVRSYQPEYGYRTAAGGFESVEARQRRDEHADGWRTECDELVVYSDGSVYWRAYDKYSGARYSTEWVALKDLRTATEASGTTAAGAA